MDASRRFSPRKSAWPVEIDVCFFEPWRNVSICSPAPVPGRTAMRPGFGLRLRIDIIVTLFPEPDSPTTPRVSPRPHRERDAVDGLDDPVVGLEVRPEVADVEQRLGAHTGLLHGALDGAVMPA